MTKTKRSAADTLKVYEYSGARMAVAELLAGVDCGEPQRVARAIAEHSEREAFLRGVFAAYEAEATPPALKEWAATTNGWAERFYRDLCREACVA